MYTEKELKKLKEDLPEYDLNPKWIVVSLIETIEHERQKLNKLKQDIEELKESDGIHVGVHNRLLFMLEELKEADKCLTT